MKISSLELVHELLPKLVDTLLPVLVAETHIKHLHLHVPEQLFADYVVKNFLEGAPWQVLARPLLPALIRRLRSFLCEGLHLSEKPARGHLFLLDLRGHKGCEVLGSLGLSGLGASHAKYFLAVGVDGDLGDVLAMLDKVGGVDDGVSVVLLPLLQILAVFDPVLERPHLPLVLAIGVLLVLVLLDSVGQEVLEPIVVGSLVVEVGLVGVVGVEGGVEVVDVLLGVGVELDLVVPG